MQNLNFEIGIDRILENDPRFHRDAYLFVREALDFTQREISKANEGELRHISGQELLEGIRKFALELYGPMTRSLFQEWGITRCEDFGEIVFNLVDCELLKKTESDCREDFAGGYDFTEAFQNPFLPSAKKRPVATDKKA